MLNFLLDLIPTWVWLIIAAAGLFGAWRYLGTKGALALLAAIVTAGAYRHGRKEREHEEAVRKAQEQLLARRISDDIDDAIAGRAPAKNREGLKQWSRS